VTQTETRIFHYDLLGHIIAETNQTGQMLAEYIYLGGQLLAMIKPGEAAYYFHNDHLGTPQVLTDGTGSVAWKAAYTPFGETVISIATVENPFRFPGQYYDQETGLHYNYFRYYNPQTGRYITPDPIGLEGGINLFAYVGNNPVNWIDTFGLSTITFDRTSGTLTVYSGLTGLPAITGPASNNASNPGGNPWVSGSHGPLPTGTFPTGRWLPTGNDPNSPLGDAGFIPIYLIPSTRPGLGIHAGRLLFCNSGRCGSNFPTDGCIRTTSDILMYLKSDPPTSITIR
jgi:RHS repeat-associated protein